MTKIRSISFGEFRRFLHALGFSEKRAEAAWVFRHPSEGLVVLRLYREDEAVDQRDLLSTRKFLDMRGLVEAPEFDRFIQEASTPA